MRHRSHQAAKGAVEFVPESNDTQTTLFYCVVCVKVAGLYYLISKLLILPLSRVFPNSNFAGHGMKRFEDWRGKNKSTVALCNIISHTKKTSLLRR